MGAPVPRTAAMGGKQTVVVLQLKAHGKGQLQKTAGIGLGLHLVVQPGQKGLELQPRKGSEGIGTRFKVLQSLLGQGPKASGLSLQG